MLSKEPILGQYRLKIDHKNRIILPVNRGILATDHILIIEDDLAFYHLVDRQSFLLFIKTIEDKLAFCDDIEEMQYLRQYIYWCYAKVTADCVIDAQSRILLSSPIAECVADANNYATLYGANTEILLLKNN